MEEYIEPHKILPNKSYTFRMKKCTIDTLTDAIAHALKTIKSTRGKQL